MIRKSAPGFPKKADPITVHDAGDVLLAIAPFFQQTRDFLQVGYGVQVARGLFGAVASVQIRADGGVQRITGQLADVVDVIGHCF